MKLETLFRRAKFTNNEILRMGHDFFKYTKTGLRPNCPLAQLGAKFFNTNHKVTGKTLREQFEEMGINIDQFNKFYNTYDYNDNQPKNAVAKRKVIMKAARQADLYYADNGNKESF